MRALDGSYDGAAWRSTPEHPFRLKTIGTWSPFEQEGSRKPEEILPDADFCSAHYFDVDGALVTYAWYGEGTRFLDISDPAARPARPPGRSSGRRPLRGTGSSWRVRPRADRARTSELQAAGHAGRGG